MTTLDTNITDLVPLNERTQEQTNTENVNKGTDRALANISAFRDELPFIVAKINSSQQEGAVSAIQKQLLLTALAIIPVAEQEYISKSHLRGAENLLYAFNSAVSSVRELVQDIEANKDRATITSKISSNVLHPAFIMIGQRLIDQDYKLKRRLIESGLVSQDKLKELNQITGEVMNKPMMLFMEASYKDISSKIVDMLES